jgi:hypothetical protein
MEPSTDLSLEQIIDAYMKYLSINGKTPTTFYSFANSLSVSEAELYEYFTSFDALEKRIYMMFFDKTLKLLHANEEYQTFDVENKLLSFYYTFFELLKVNRSFVTCTLIGNGSSDWLKRMAKLSELKNAFVAYIKELGIDDISLPTEKLSQIKERTVSEFAWGQLLFTLKFWLEDTSPKMEKTDLLIEKEIAVTFALLDASSLNKIIDLGKFWFKEKLNFA